MTIHFFDWDGTIVSGRFVRTAYTQHCKAIGIVMTNEEQETIEKTGNFWTPIKERFEKVLPDRSHEEVHATADRLFWHFYGEELKKEIRTKGQNAYVPGMYGLIERLSTLGHQVSIATLAREDMVREFLKATGLSKYITHVFGQTEFFKPSKQAMLRSALELSLPKHLLEDPIHYAIGEHFFTNATMTGDRPSDITAGKSVGARTYFAKWGNGILNGVLPTACVNNAEELYEHLIAEDLPEQ